MPFELGLDLGCKVFSKKDKKCLILEEKPYRYQEVISDIAGQDISSHNNDPIMIVKEVRNWIFKLGLRDRSKAYTTIWDLYNEFLYDFDNDMKAENLNPDRLWEIPFSELIDMMTAWVKSKTKK